MYALLFWCTSVCTDPPRATHQNSTHAVLYFQPKVTTNALGFELLGFSLYFHIFCASNRLSYFKHIYIYIYIYICLQIYKMNRQHATNLYFNKVPTPCCCFVIFFFYLYFFFHTYEKKPICRQCHYLCLDLRISYIIVKGRFVFLAFQSLVYMS